MTVIVNTLQNKVRQTVLKDKLFAMKKSYQFPTTKELQAQIDEITQLQNSGLAKKKEIDHSRKASQPEKLTSSKQLTSGRLDYYRYRQEKYTGVNGI